MEHIISDDSVTRPQVGDTCYLLGDSVTARRSVTHILHLREPVAEECRISNIGVNERGED